MKMSKTFASLFLAGCAAIVGGATMVAPTPAMAQEDEEKPRQRSETLDPAVAKVLQEVFTLMQEEQYSAAQGQINALIASRGDRMKPFDKGTTYELLGSIQVNLDNYRGALSSFQTALNSGGLPANRNNQLRYFIAQIYFQLEDFDSAIRGLNDWIRAAQSTGEKVDANAYYLLAAAYVQKTPSDYRSAMSPAERVLPLRTEQKKGDYDLLNLIYSELNENTKRADLLEKMINIWPSERSYWTQLGGLYSTIGRDKEAFSIIEVAYRAGLLEKESEILTLVQYYSFFDNPYRGAKLLSREMEAGRVKRNQNNLILLSQLWSQSREHKRAIPILREAAGNSSDGELSYRLGQVLLADEQYAPSIRALGTALQKGGMNPRQTGDAWLLLGTARFSNAGPDDCDGRLRAKDAFQSATRFSNSGGQARDWVTYIDAINDTEYSQKVLENAQNLEAAQSARNRLRTQVQVCRLQGGGECAKEEAAFQENEDRIKELQQPGRIIKCGAKPPAAEEVAEDTTPAEEEAPAPDAGTEG